MFNSVDYLKQRKFHYYSDFIGITKISCDFLLRMYKLRKFELNEFKYLLYIKHSKIIDLKTLSSLIRSNFSIIEIGKFIYCFSSLSIAPSKLKQYFIDMKLGDGLPDDKDIVERVKCIILLGKDSNSEKSFKLRFGEQEGLSRWLICTNNKSLKNSREYLLKTLSKEQFEARFRNMGCSLDNFVAIYGVERGTLKWDSYKSKRNKTYKLNKESGRKYTQFSITNFIKLYGEIEGTKIFNEIASRRNFSNSKNFFFKISNNRKLKEFVRIGGDFVH